MPAPDPAERRHILRGAIECAIGLNTATPRGQASTLTNAVWRVIEPALAQRDDQITAVHARIDAMAETPELRQWADALRAALRTRPGPLPPAAWCGASMPGAGGTPIGPCVLRHGHDGPVHQAADGAKWWPEQTLDVVDLMPLPACPTGKHPAHPAYTCEEQEQAADAWDRYARGVWGAALAGIATTDVPPALQGPGWEPPPGAPQPLRDLAARALDEEQPQPAIVDARPPFNPDDFLPGYPTEADFDAAPPPRFTGLLGSSGITPDQCRAEDHRPGYPSARCDLPAGHTENHRDRTIPGVFRWDDSVAMYPTTSTEDGQ